MRIVNRVCTTRFAPGPAVRARTRSALRRDRRSATQAYSRPSSESRVVHPHDGQRFVAAGRGTGCITWRVDVLCRLDSGNSGHLFPEILTPRHPDLTRPSGFVKLEMQVRPRAVASASFELLRSRGRLACRCRRGLPTQRTCIDCSCVIGRKWTAESLKGFGLRPCEIR